MSSGTPPKKPPLQFGKPEKPNWVMKFVIWGFIVIGIAAIVWMVAISSPENALVCDRAIGPGSLLEFGRCHEDIPQ